MGLQRIGWYGKKKKNTFGDQKCFVRVVKETHRKEGHNRAELGFSQHKKEKKSVFFFFLTHSFFHNSTKL